MFDYKVTCSYDKFAAIQEVLCSGEIHKTEKRGESPVTVSGLIQHIADTFDADISSPNGMACIHSLATIECFPESDNTNEPQSFHRISKDEMKKPVHYDEHDDELIPFRGEGIPCRPPLPHSELPDEFHNKQSRMKGLEKWILNFSR